MSDKQKTHTLSFRLDEYDFELIRLACEGLGMKRSDYLRYLLQAPLVTEGVDLGKDKKVIVLDRKTFPKMAIELIKWGNHYNQAVHAMNTIALQIRNGHIDDEWFAEMLEKIERKLSEVDDGRRELADKIDDLENRVYMGEV